MLKQRIRRLESVVQRFAQSVRANSPPRNLQTAQDLVDLVQEQIEAIRAEPWAETLEKARAIAQLAETARKVIETRDAVVRAEMLELVLKQRKSPFTQQR